MFEDLLDVIPRGADEACSRQEQWEVEMHPPLAGRARTSRRLRANAGQGAVQVSVAADAAYAPLDHLVEIGRLDEPFELREHRLPPVAGGGIVAQLQLHGRTHLQLADPDARARDLVKDLPGFL